MRFKSMHRFIFYSHSLFFLVESSFEWWRTLIVMRCGWRSSIQVIFWIRHVHQRFPVLFLVGGIHQTLLLKHWNVAWSRCWTSKMTFAIFYRNDHLVVVVREQSFLKAESIGEVYPSYSNGEKDRYVCRPSRQNGAHDSFDRRKQAVKMADVLG